VSSVTQLIVSVLVRRDGPMLLVEEITGCDCAPLESFLSGEAPAGATYVADRT